jgi:hypothetical protein
VIIYERHVGYLSRHEADWEHTGTNADASAEALPVEKTDAPAIRPGDRA